MSEFKRENRYLVIKWKDAVSALGTRDLDRLQGIADAVAEHRGTKGKAPLSCVVVEADWPIYERVWDEIQRLESTATIKGLQDEVEELRRQLDDTRRELIQVTTQRYGDVI